MLAAGIRSPAFQRSRMPQLIMAKPARRRPKASPSRTLLRLRQAAMAAARAASRMTQERRTGFKRL